MSKQTSTIPTSSTALTGDAASLVGILDWARGAGVDVSELTVGGVTIKVRGGMVQHQGDSDDKDRDDGPARDQQRIYAQFGGDMLTQALADKLPGVELQPAIGRRAG